MTENKHLRYGLLLAGLMAVASFQSAKHGDLKVSITQIRNSDGAIELNLFKNADGFPDETAKAIKHVRSTIVNGSCTCTFGNIPYGQYAISVYHDENNDRKFNTTWYGKPREGVAVSNNVSGGITGPPPFEKAMFEFNTQTPEVKIVMHYF